MSDRHKVIEVVETGLSGIAVAAGQPELVPGIVAAGESLDHVMDIADDATQLYDDIASVSKIVKEELSEPVTNNSDMVKAMKVSHAAGGAGPGAVHKPVPTYLSHAKGADRKKPQLLLTNSVVPKTLTSSLNRDEEYIGSNTLLNDMGHKRLVKLRAVLGKATYPDTITPFLKNLNGHATIRMQFAGRCISKVNERHTHMQFFRHRLSNNTLYNRETGTAAPYPTNMLPNILGPQNVNTFVPAGGAATTGWGTGVTSFRDILDTQDYWAPYNLADLEDCSWNLNGLKLYPQNFGATGTGASPIKLANQVGTLQSNSHHRSSFLSYNNSQLAAVSTRPSTYRYKAVINKGSVAYEFMNKGDAGAKVEVIVYRMKRGVSTVNNATFTVLNSDLSYCNKLVTTPIGNGYIDSNINKAGTDILSGRIPLASDVFSSALFPLLKHYKKTKQIDMPYVEVSRQVFALPSGGRRDVEIVLPGICYDPQNQAGGTGASLADYPGILDEHCYGVYVAVCGTPCTQEISEGNSSYNVGDMICKANVQFTATYSEHIGACSYKEPVAQQMYCQGQLLPPMSDPATIPTGFTVKPVVIAPMSMAARVPGTTSAGLSGTTTTTSTTQAGINLSCDVTAVPPT